MPHHESYITDQKKYRKIRKYLRQIEHLQLLTRELNHEEKQKVHRKKEYREQLNKLTHKYMNEESFFNLGDSSMSAVTVDTSEAVANAEDNAVLDELTEELAQQMDKISIEDEKKDEEREEEKVESPVVELEEIKPVVDVAEPREQAPVESNEFKVVEKKSKKAKKAAAESVQVVEDKKVVESVKETKKPQPQAKKEPKQKAVEVPKPPQPAKPNVSFRTFKFNDAHEDLIVSIDLCIEFNLIVTGSRDTSLKVWSFENPSKIKLIHSFGGHSSPITQVKFWKYELFKACLERISEYDDDAETILEKLNERDTNLPVIVSSSLDQTLRIWDITEGRCLKELYLYNRVNCFDISSHSFAIGLDGGKIQYWNNLTQIVSLKCYEDTESVCCVKLDTTGDERRVYGLSHTGLLKVFKINKCQSDKESLELFDESDIYDQLSESHLLKKNFKCFELLNQTQVLMINDNQSFVIFHDLTRKTNMLISTNTNNYGFTNCLYRLNNKCLISAYNIDDASTNINVFEFEKEIQNPKSQITYQFTLEDVEGDSCISSMSALASNNVTYISSGSGKNITLWKVETAATASAKTPPSNRPAKFLKMCKHSAFHTENQDEEEEEEDSDSDDQNETRESNAYEEKKKEDVSRCVIQ